MSARTLTLDDRTYAWMLAHGTREPEVGARLRAETAAHPMARMQISPEQGQLLEWLVKALGVRRAVEVGTFTGYSALRIALALPDGGHLTCCDVSEEYTAIARRAWAEAGVTDRITLRLGPAVDTLAALIADGARDVDLVFIDADKESYAAYVEAAWTLLRTGGVVAIDNTLWSGRVADPADTEPSTEALRELATRLVADERWDLSLVPIGDGLTLLRKR
jgi:predicted O-methyltransferase YrrM